MFQTTNQILLGLPHSTWVLDSYWRLCENDANGWFYQLVDWGCRMISGCPKKNIQYDSH